MHGETPQLDAAEHDADAMSVRILDEHVAFRPLSTPRLINRVYNLPFNLTGINVGLAAHWIFSEFFGGGRLDIGAPSLGALLVGGIAVLVVTAVLPFVGMLASWPARGVGLALRAGLGLPFASRSLTRTLARGWVPLRNARQTALAERDRYWTSRVDSALAACVHRARRTDQVELQGFACLVLLAFDASCSPSLVPSLLRWVGLTSCADWLGCGYVLLALLWCWSVSGDVVSSALIYHPVLARQLACERAQRRSPRARVARAGTSAI